MLLLLFEFIIWFVLFCWIVPVSEIRLGDEEFVSFVDGVLIIIFEDEDEDEVDEDEGNDDGEVVE